MTVWIKLNRLTPLTLIGSRNSLRKDFTEIAEIVSFFFIYSTITIYSVVLFDEN